MKNIYPGKKLRNSLLALQTPKTCTKFLKIKY